MSGRAFLSLAITTSATVYFAAVVGCSNKPHGSPENPEAQHIGKVGGWAGAYAKAHKGKAPKSIEQLKKWAEEKEGAKDEDFVSTRDGQPYVMTVPRMGGDVRIHEQTGAGGDNDMIYMVTPGADVGGLTSKRGLEMMTMSGGTTPGSGGGGGPMVGPGGVRGGASNPGNPGEGK